MSFSQDFRIVVQEEWPNALYAQTLIPAPMIRLLMLESDLESLQLAFEDYDTARQQVNNAMASLVNSQNGLFSPPVPNKVRARMFHSAKVFIVCMRRFARLLEAAKSRKNEYPPDVGEIIDLTWKKLRAFLDNYREARDAIEHIDGEIDLHTKFTNISGDYFEVVEGKRAHVTLLALQTVEQAWAEIVREIMRPVEKRIRAVLIERFLYVLRTKLAFHFPQ